MKNIRIFRIASTLICAVLLFSSIAQARGKSLPKAARAAIKEMFPKATIGDVESEREFGILYYDVEIRENGNKKGVGVSAEGTIGEIEYRIKPSELPKNLRGIVKSKIKGGKLIRIEKYERLGSAKSGTWETLPAPSIRYEIKFRKNGKKDSFIVEEAGTIGPDPEDPAESVEDEEDNDNEDVEGQEIAIQAIPEVIQNSIRQKFPKIEIKAVAVISGGSGEYFEIEVAQNGREYEIKSDSEGKILEISEEMELNHLPKPVRDTLQNQFASFKIGEIERKFADNKLSYEVKLKNGDNELEVVINPAGNVLSSEKADN